MSRSLRIPDAEEDTGAWTVILDPSEVADDRTELDINSADITVSQDGIDWGDAAIQEYLADMQVGSAPVDYRIPNRTVAINLGIGGSDEAAFYTAKQALQQKVSLIQREGGWLKRGDDVPMYADVVNATLTMVDQWGETGFIELAKLELECVPDFYGDEITLDTISSTGYCDAVLEQSGVQAVIEGDHPARCRIIVTDASGTDQLECYWGVRSRHYDDASTAALVIAATDLTKHSGSVVTASGSQFTDVVEWTDVGGNAMDLDISGALLTHVGTYEVFVRAFASEADCEFTLAWEQGTSAFTNNIVTNDTATLPAAGDWFLLSLGMVTLTQAPIGTSAWTASINFAGSGAAGSIWFDYIALLPVDESAAHLSSEPTIPGDSTAEIRSDGVWAVVTGSVYAPIASFTGDLPRLPPSGMEGRPCELFVKPLRSDGDFVGKDAGVDSFSVQVKYRPVYLFRP